MGSRIPTGEQVWVVYCRPNGETAFILTSKQSRDFYFLYEARPDGSLVKLGKARSPTELEDKFDVPSKIRT